MHYARYSLRKSSVCISLGQKTWARQATASWLYNVI